jgi:hypothetical protein
MRVRKEKKLSETKVKHLAYRIVAIFTLFFHEKILILLFFISISNITPEFLIFRGEKQREEKNAPDDKSLKESLSK